MPAADEPRNGAQDWTGSDIGSGNGGSGGGRGGDVGSSNTSNYKHNSSSFSATGSFTQKVTSHLETFRDSFLRGNGNTGNTIIHQAGNKITMNEHRNQIDNSSHVNNDHSVQNYGSWLPSSFRRSATLGGSPSLPSSKTRPTSPPSNRHSESLLSRASTSPTLGHNPLSETPNAKRAESDTRADVPAGESIIKEPTGTSTRNEVTTVNASLFNAHQEVTSTSSDTLAAASLEAEGIDNSRGFLAQEMAQDVPDTSERHDPVVEKTSCDDHLVSDSISSVLVESESTRVTNSTESPVHAFASTADLLMSSTASRIETGAIKSSKASEENHSHADEAGEDDRVPPSSVAISPALSTSPPVLEPATPLSPPPADLPCEATIPEGLNETWNNNAPELELKRLALDEDIRAMTKSLVACLPTTIFKDAKDICRFIKQLQTLFYILASGSRDGDMPKMDKNQDLFSFSHRETAILHVQLRRMLAFTRVDANYVIRLTNVFLSDVLEKVGNRLPPSSEIEIPNIYHEHGPSIAFMFYLALDLDKYVGP